jgi:hypothetical protein
LRVTQGGAEHLVVPCEDVTVEQGHADAIVVELEIDEQGERRICSLPSDLAIVEHDDSWSDTDSVILLVTRDTVITSHALLDIARGAAFSPSTERDADSWETQRDHFDRDALQRIRTLLVGEEAGIIGRVVDRIEATVRWLVPDGRALLISVRQEEVAACFQDRPAAYLSDQAFTEAVTAQCLRGIVDPAWAADALAQIRVIAHERALDLMALGSTPTADEGVRKAG